MISIPSSDSSPLSVFESIACKTPVLLSDLPWISHKLKKENCIILSKLDSNSLANATIKALSNSNKKKINKLHQIVFDDINAIKESKKLENLYFNIK